MVLVQNKIDLSYISMVSRESIQQVSRKLDLPLFVTSAKKNINIDEGNDLLHSLDSPSVF